MTLYNTYNHAIPLTPYYNTFNIYFLYFICLQYLQSSQIYRYIYYYFRTIRFFLLHLRPVSNYLILTF